MKNNIKNNRKKYLSMIGFAVVSTTALILTPAFVKNNISNEDGISIKNNEQGVSSNYISGYNDKSLNETFPNELVNSKFYFSDFTFLDPDQGENTTTALVGARAQWGTIRSNLREKYSEFSNTSGYTNIIKILDDLDLWANNSLVVREALRVAGQMHIWEAIKNDLGYKPFAEIVGTAQDMQKNLKVLSGFISGSSDSHAIASINNIASPELVDLTQATTTPINITGDYKTVIKIAEINPTSFTGNLKINFVYSNTTNSNMASRGSLVIRNKNKQLTNQTLKENQDNLEIFGRWNNLGNNAIDPSTNFKPAFDNFILSKDPTTGIVSLMARLKDGDSLNDIKVDTSNGGSSLANFGIIDALIDSSKPIYDTTNTTYETIKFFSTNLIVSPATSTELSTEFPSEVINPTINKKYEFYVGNDTTFNTNLFYKNIDEKIYKNLFGFEEDKVSETRKQSLSFGVTAGEGSNIANSNIELSPEVLSQLKLSENNASNLSVSLKTEKNEAGTIFKQGIYFNDLLNFAIIGNPIESRKGFIISLDSQSTDKIFFEDPGFIASTTKASTLSSALASKWVNRESEIIAALSKIYEQWSKPQDPIGTVKLGNKSFNKISYIKQGNIYKDISWNYQIANYNGKEIYLNIVNEYETYTNIISQLIPGKIINKNNLFEIGGTAGGSAQNIIKTQILQVENIAEKERIMSAVKAIIDSSTSQSDKDLAIEGYLSELIRMKFSEMKSTLTDPINTFYYEEIKKYLNSNLANKQLINDPKTFLDFNLEEGLYSLKNGVPVLGNAASVTGSQKMESIFNLLYFGPKDYDLQKTYFGNVIFSPISTNGAFESVLDIFLSLQSQKEVLWKFESTTSQIQSNSVNIYDRFLSIFGFGITNIIDNSLKTGAAIELKWGTKDLNMVIDQILNNFNSSSLESTTILNKNYEYNSLKSLVTSANIYNSLLYRKLNPPVGIAGSEALIKEDNKKIINIINSGIVQSKDIFTWSRIQKFGNDINLYTENFSENMPKILEFSNEIKLSPDILDRVIHEEEALFNVNNFFSMQVVWVTVVSLISVGMIVASSTSLAGKNKIMKSSISNGKLIKIILILSIVLSLVALGLVFGLVVPGMI